MTTPTAPTTKGDSQLSSLTLLQVDESETGTPDWLPVFGLSGWTDNVTPNMVENTDYDDVDPETGELWTGRAVASLSWQATCTLSDKEYGAGGDQDPGQAFLEQHHAQLVHVRWFDRKGKREAKEGYARVTFSRGDNSGLSSVSLTLEGDGRLRRAANPLAPEGTG